MVWSLAPNITRQSSDGKLKSRKIVQFWRRLPAWGLTMPDWLLQNLTSSLLWEIVLIAGGAAALAYLKKKWPIPGRPVPLRFLNTTDSLRIVAGAAKRPALFPQLFPIPDPVRVRQRESELMREHTHLPAMVGFVRKHVAQHFQAHRPRPSPAVSAKLLDAAPTTRRALQRASPRSERRSRPILHGLALAYSACG